MLIGIDEVGRGAWAGPMLVAAVSLLRPVKGLVDSKTLSPKNRETLSREIKTSAGFIGLGWVSNLEIDDLGLTSATKLGVERSLPLLDPKEHEIVIDGSIDFVDSRNSRAVVGADSTVSEVSAASIIAKVARDNFMKNIDKLYPQFSFKSNVGYGTAAHRKGLIEAGSCPLHRQSYKPIKRINEHQNREKSRGRSDRVSQEIGISDN